MLMLRHSHSFCQKRRGPGLWPPVTIAYLSKLYLNTTILALYLHSTNGIEDSTNDRIYIVQLIPNDNYLQNSWSHVLCEEGDSDADHSECQSQRLQDEGGLRSTYLISYIIDNLIINLGAFESQLVGGQTVCLGLLV